jgi:uncharacterized membrane protein
VGEGFTELYILGLSGEVADYPEELKVGGGEAIAVIDISFEPSQRGILTCDPAII